MSLPTNTLIEKEWKKDTEDFFEKFLNHEENWHNGETLKYENNIKEAEDVRYAQYRTTIINDNQEQNCFIYDEIISINNKPVLLLKIDNSEKREILESIIYLEKNEVVQQIRNLSYKQFEEELKNNEKLIKTEESENTVIIKTPFLDFIKNVEKKEQENEEAHEKESVMWKIFGVSIFVIAWCSIPVIGNLLIAPLLIGLVSSSVMTWLPFVVAGLIAGSVVKGLSEIAKKIKKWTSSKKDKHEIELEKKLNEQEKKLNEEFEKKLFSFLTPELKQERILNTFHQIWEKNKIKDFDTLQKELNKKFDENKYAKQIENGNINWNEKVEFTKFLKPENIKEIKETFDEYKKNNWTIPSGSFYQPEDILEKFQAEKIKKMISEKKENVDKITRGIDKHRKIFTN